MHRRTASALSEAHKNSSTVLPLSHGCSTANASPPRKGRLRPTSKYTAVTHHGDWVSLDKRTVTKLAIVAAVAFCSVHFYLFHTYLSRNTSTATRVNYSSSSLHRHNEPPTTVDTVPVAAAATDFVNASFSIRPLRIPDDYTRYTIRINTWKRLETLRLSIQHHATCPAVAQIQVVWCTAQGPPPEWLQQYNDNKQRGDDDNNNKVIVIVEQHHVNSLNERFHVLLSAGENDNDNNTAAISATTLRDTPTMGILSLDDDLLRPCIAYDVAFWKWTQHPDRMVGFDARSHEIASNNDNNKKEWKYAYKSTTEKTNRYSLTLTRCSFVHLDYLHHYMHSPALAPIRQFVQEHLNCEDIAMSFMVSSLTQGQAPLLAPYWAVHSMIKLDEGANKISATADHKRIRDACVNQFAELLGLKESAASSDGGGRSIRNNKNDHKGVPLQTAKLKHSSWFEYGALANTSRQPLVDGLLIPDYLEQSLARENKWKTDVTLKLLRQELAESQMKASRVAYDAGLVQGTEPWKARFKRGDGKAK